MDYTQDLINDTLRKVANERADAEKRIRALEAQLDVERENVDGLKDADTQLRAAAEQLGIAIVVKAVP